MYTSSPTLTNPLAYLTGDRDTLPYLLEHHDDIEVAPEMLQMYNLAKSFIFFEDDTEASVIVILDIAPRSHSGPIRLELSATGQQFTSKRLTFNLGHAVLDAHDKADARNTYSTDHREWLKWASSFYEHAGSLDADADLDLYLVAASAYREEPAELVAQAYAHLRWHISQDGAIFVVPVI